MASDTAKVEVARRLSKLHGLGFRAHNAGELSEHCSRNPSPSPSNAFAERTGRTDFLFCDDCHGRSSSMGYLEGQRLGEAVGSRGKCFLFPAIPQAIRHSTPAYMGPQPSVADCGGSRCGCFLMAR